ncbi:3-beta hydroxysteroid dehydrogenase/isomerase family protein [Ceratobasidium sp. AG-Ba]|nr:3-beta hydroxysteroid dehydrogenase/isomerase family protein [Ceratobasidium sp. AG-Ba]
MEEDGAFDEAVRGVNAVIHTASPCTFEANDPKELINPAVNGTLGVLKSIEKHAPQIRRVIYTSSTATIVDPSKPPGTIYTDDDWNTYSLEQVEKKGKDAGNDMYRASKILAEKAAWADNFGDVRDVALAHVRALEVPEAGGQRFITALEPHTWQDALDVLPPSYPRGEPGAGKSVTHIVFDSSKAERVLGIKFRSFEETVKDTERDLRRRGWLLNN